MSSVPRPSPATWADVLAAPEGMTAELIDGALLMSPRPAIPHQRVAIGLASWLYRAFHGPKDRGPDRPGGWVILAEAELHLGQPDPKTLVLAPDLSGWRLPRHPGAGAAAEIVPDWVCEILSPNSARRDRILKLDTYARVGVRHAWIVDPAAQTLEAYARAEHGIWQRVAACSLGDSAAIPPFEGVQFEPIEGLDGE